MMESIYTANMTQQQRAWFYAEYERARRDEVVGVLLALFLGAFGAHHFYLRRNGLGVLYLLFFWTGISSLLGFIECFFMPGRVRDFNAAQAMMIAAHITGSPAAYAMAGQPVYQAGAAGWNVASAVETVCPACGAPVTAGALFCPNCGAAVERAQPKVAEEFDALMVHTQYAQVDRKYTRDEMNER